MGIDFGTRRVGISISDPEGIVAGSPSVIHVRSRKEAVGQITEIVVNEGVVEIVVGLPVSLSGELGPQADKTREFASQLSSACGLNVNLWDERLSTVEAQRLLLGLGKRIRKQKEKRDLIAAVLILQSYLDRKSHASGQKGSQ
jgi:putative Holliday junction resolvase